MNECTPVDFAYHFSTSEDFRVERNKRHLLLDLIIIALCAVLCGADDCGKRRRRRRDVAS